MFYRAYLQLKYETWTEWRDFDEWRFFTKSPDEFVESCQHPQVKHRIKYLHIISEDDFKNKRVYTRPIEQIIFH